MKRPMRNAIQHPRSSAGNRRSGMLVICVLISLVLLMGLFAVWVRTLSNEREQLRLSQNRLQAEYLTRSGIQRAAALLARDAAYAGETWQVAIPTVSGSAPAEVVIRVAAVDGRPQARSLQVTADYPVGSLAKARRSQETTIELPTGGEKP